MIRILLRIVKWSCLVIALLVLGVVALYLFVDPARYNSYLASRLEDAARAHGVNLKTEGFSVHPTRIEARSMDAFVPRALFGLTVGDVQIGYSVLKFLKGSVESTIQATLYQGKADIRSAVNLADMSGRASGSLKGIKVSEHPQIAGIGFTGGELNAEIPSAVLESGVLSEARFSLEIRDLVKPLSSTIPIPIQGTRVPFQIPPFTAEKVSAAGFIENELLTLEAVHIDSSLGELSLNGVISKKRTVRSHTKLTLSVALTAEGQRVIGPYLPLLGTEGITPESSCFGCDFEHTARGLVSACAPEQCG